MIWHATTRLSTHRVPSLVLLLACLGCADDPQAEGEVISRAEMISAPEIIVGGEPTWATRNDSERPLHQVEDAATLASGEIAVLTQEAVAVYDRAGRRARTIGRPGKGPGEFTRAFDLIVAGDSLVVFDLPERKIMVFSSDGELRDQIVLREDSPEQLLSVLEDGNFLFKKDDWGERTTEFKPAYRIYLRFSPEGVVLDTLGQHVYAEVATLPEVGVRTWRTFAPVASTAAGPRGVWATTGGPEVTHYDLQGRPSRTVTWEAERRRVTTKDLAQYVENWVQLYPSDMHAAARARMRVTPVADTFPATSALALGLDGRLWVEKYQPYTGSKPRQWMVFDTAGAIQGWVTLPPKSMLYEAGADHVLVELVDSLGVESVAKYRLETPNSL